MGLHAARVDRSARLQRIVAVLKAAAHPLSAEEIAIRGYDFAMSKKIMLNVSTAIGELRAQVNRDAGYFVSDARMLRSSRYPWHDGRPRYWLIAAPGWLPTWMITADGDLEMCGHKRNEAAATGAPAEAPAGDPVDRLCKNPKCGKPLSPEDPLSWFCGDDCRRQWREGLQIKKLAKAEPQGELFE